ncbi:MULTISPECIES: substrate-binding periplasmic protein [Pseudomonas]|jgi:polar amino acid transport system substrate-binding protein|uniref:substrate-binding periplasmic protein n=1 Tax=Pseudomonas TaxID=286 RepID=UPI0006D489C9|nr:MULTISPECIES: ABC transporter substrate-binding protein [Pseudomonas]MBG8561280.1 ABC transporter substrate-binding protein [Pseudomonas qingdaonensis]MCP8347956.1 amino acid ABC transporter substrate-binding protein [Pseudomonas sp. FBF18]MDD1954925.1 ABC transporter substrate-binding protein [Pseudomonas sp. 8209]MEC6744481.1 ABC transporter substrate-binding protein [Pseudomonas qingdaonensis]OOW05214.1 amino acid ABC transporter substrate-binding protein [Pseudomonas sp. MF6396]
MFTRLLVVLVSLFSLAATVRAADPMVLLTENFPPYNMASDGKNFAREDKIQGIAADLVREMFKRAAIPYSMTLRFPWERVYQQALNSPNHGVFVMARQPDREKLFKWVGPLGPDDWILLARPDSPITLEHLGDARGYRIGAYKGDAIAQHLSSKGLKPITVLRDQDNARKLLEGQIDLWATGDPAGRYLARQIGITQLKTVLRFNGAQLYLALNRQVPDAVVEKLQHSLDQLRDEGFVDATFARYL